MTVAEFQELIERLYLDRDQRRGLERTFVWFVEEVGELARALHRGEPEELAEEFADVFAWLTTLASLCGVRLTEAIEKYRDGCPKCGTVPCQCGPIPNYERQPH